VACQRRQLVATAEQFGKDGGADEAGGADQGDFHAYSNKQLRKHHAIGFTTA
jgi:hypothetical protein